MTIEDLKYAIGKSLSLPLEYLYNPEKRIFYVYILTSLLLAFYVYATSKSNTSFHRYILNKKIWFSSSALVDYKLMIFNSFFKVFFIAPFLFFVVHLSMLTENFLIKHIGYSAIRLNKTETLIYYTLALTIINDFLSYVTHLLFHKVPFLWEFHKVHHSATVLNPITQYRLHPIELLINNLKFIFIFGILTGLFEYLSCGIVNKALFMGVNVLSFFFLLWGANLRHSHVKLTYFNFLEYIFISPFQHQIHHSDSPVHFNKNLGSKFAIWDWLFGTLQRSKSVDKITFGLGQTEHVSYNSFLKNMIQPFRNVTKIILQTFVKKPPSN